MRGRGHGCTSFMTGSRWGCHEWCTPMSPRPLVQAGHVPHPAFFVIIRDCIPGMKYSSSCVDRRITNPIKNPSSFSSYFKKSQIKTPTAVSCSFSEDTLRLKCNVPVLPGWALVRAVGLRFHPWLFLEQEIFQAISETSRLIHQIEGMKTPYIQ